MELAKEIKAVLYDRVSNPFFGYFVAWWLVFNFDFLLIVTGKTATLEHLKTYFAYESCGGYKFISLLCSFDWIKQYSTGFWYLVAYRLILPTLFTFITIRWILPLINLLIYKHYVEEVSKLKKIKQEAENAQLLTIEESREIRELSSRLERERDQLKDENARLKDSSNYEKKQATVSTRI